MSVEQRLNRNGQKLSFFGGKDGFITGNVILRALSGKRKSDYFTKYDSLLNKNINQNKYDEKTKKLLILIHFHKINLNGKRHT